jgi:hypothetical protein
MSSSGTGFRAVPRRPSQLSRKVPSSTGVTSTIAKSNKRWERAVGIAFVRRHVNHTCSDVIRLTPRPTDASRSGHERHELQHCKRRKSAAEDEDVLARASWVISRETLYVLWVIQESFALRGYEPRIELSKALKAPMLRSNGMNFPICSTHPS